MSRAIVIHNPSAGADDHGRESLIASLREAGWECVAFRSSKEDDLARVLREPADIVVVAGGDGTVARVMRAMPDGGPPIAILPLGTSNGIARSLEAATHVSALPRQWHRFHPHAFRLGEASGALDGLFAEAAGAGAIAQAIAEADAADAQLAGDARLAAGRARIAAILARGDAAPLTAYADGVALPEPLVLVEALIVGVTGPRLFLAPQAEPAAETLDVVYLTASRAEAFRDWLQRDDGTPAPLAHLTSRALVIAGEGAFVRLDDEPRRCSGPVSITLRRSARRVHVLAPAPTPPDHGDPP